MSYVRTWIGYLLSVIHVAPINNNNSNNAICIAQIRRKQQMGCGRCPKRKAFSLALNVSIDMSDRDHSPKLFSFWGGRVLYTRFRRQTDRLTDRQTDGQHHRVKPRICEREVNPLDSKDNYSTTSNNTKLVHWPLMDGLLHLVQRGGAADPPSPSSLYQM